MGSNSPSGWVLTPPTGLPLSVTMSGAGAVIDGCRGRDATAAGPERPARTADLSDPAALGEVEALTAKSVGRSGWALIASPGSVEAAERVARPDAGTGEAATTAAAPPRAVVATNVAATGAVMVVGESVAADAEGRGAARGARVAGRAARSERPGVGPADTDDDPASAVVSAAATPRAWGPATHTPITNAAAETRAATDITAAGRSARADPFPVIDPAVSVVSDTGNTAPPVPGSDSDDS